MHKFLCSTDNVCGVCDKYHVLNTVAFCSVATKFIDISILLFFSHQVQEIELVWNIHGSWGEPEISNICSQKSICNGRNICWNQFPTSFYFLARVCLAPTWLDLVTKLLWPRRILVIIRQRHCLLDRWHLPWSNIHPVSWIINEAEGFFCWGGTTSGRLQYVWKLTLSLFGAGTTREWAFKTDFIELAK